MNTNLNGSGLIPGRTFATRVSRTLVPPGAGERYKGMNLCFYYQQGRRSCTDGSPYEGMNVLLPWVEWDAKRETGGYFWQTERAARMGCNLLRPMQDGGGGSWLSLYDTEGDYLANREIAFARSVELAWHAYSLGMYYYPALNCCTYNGILPEGGNEAVAAHAAAFCAAHKDLPNVIGVDVMQEFWLTRHFCTTTMNSGGDSSAVADPASKLPTDQDTFDLVADVIAACRISAPDLPLTASSNENNNSNLMWQSPFLNEMAPIFDYLDFHCYYDAEDSDAQGVYELDGSDGKPFIVSECGGNVATGIAEQTARYQAVVENVVLDEYAGQPGCYGIGWWNLLTQNNILNDDWGATGMSLTQPPIEAGTRGVGYAIQMANLSNP